MYSDPGGYSLEKCCGSCTHINPLPCCCFAQGRVLLSLHYSEARPDSGRPWVTKFCPPHRLSWRDRFVSLYVLSIPGMCISFHTHHASACKRSHRHTRTEYFFCQGRLFFYHHSLRPQSSTETQVISISLRWKNKMTHGTNHKKCFSGGVPWSGMVSSWPFCSWLAPDFHILCRACWTWGLMGHLGKWWLEWAALPLAT